MEEAGDARPVNSLSEALFFQSTTISSSYLERSISSLEVGRLTLWPNNEDDELRAERALARDLLDEPFDVFVPGSGM